MQSLDKVDVVVFFVSRAAYSAVQGRIWLKFQLIQDVMVTLVTSKNEEDPVKIEGARVATIQNIDFPNIQGQITPQSRVESCSNSNSSKMLWLPLLLPRMKKIRSKLKALEWPQHKILIFETLKSS